MVTKNRKGWIRIVEAFVAILLIAGVFLIVVNKGQIEKVDASPKIHDVEVGILREIQLDNNLRNEILSINEDSLPIEWSGFPEEKIPNYLNCTAEICKVGDLCILEGYPDKEVYSESVIITTTLQVLEFDPRVLKLFCWNK